MRSTAPILPALTLLALASPAAWAQQDSGFDAHGFHLAAHDGDVRDPLVVQRPGAMTGGDFFLSVLGEYASAPLVLVSEAELSGDVVETPVLDHVVAANLSAGVAVHERLRFDLAAPVYATTTDPSVGQTFGPAPGDLRGSVMLLAISPPRIAGTNGFGLGLIGHVDAPIGDTDRFLGQSGVSGGVRLAATAEAGVLTLSADVGSQFNPAVDLANLNGSDTLLASLGLGLLASDNVGWTNEIVAQPPFQPADRITFPLEAMSSLRVRDPQSGAFATFGGAAGLSSGPGVAAFRAFIGAGFSRIKPLRAADVDAIGSFEIRDRCPLEAEVENGWLDDDGCPDTLAALSVSVQFDGIPWEASARIEGPEGARKTTIPVEGLAVDAVPGSEWSVTATSGNCLVGKGSAVAAETGSALTIELRQQLDSRLVVTVLGPEGEPLPDATLTMTGEAACLPVEHELPAGQLGAISHDVGVGTHHIVVTAPGYSVHEQDLEFERDVEQNLQITLQPSRVQVTAERIEILDKVQFETAQAVIKAESFALLDEVGGTILAHPSLGRVEVAGHTDSRGSDAYNLELSQSRAEAVMRYLTRNVGVPAERLVAQGYGETLPLDTNRTEEGRERNRRVEFTLIDQEPAPEEAPLDGAE